MAGTEREWRGCEVGFVARVGRRAPANAGHFRDSLRQVDHAMRLGHLVEDDDPAAVVSWAADGQFDAADRISYVDKGARLPAGSVDRQRIADRRLNQKAVE